MELNRQRRVLVAVVALAGAAWAVDRVFLGGGATGPQPVSADAYLPPVPDPVPEVEPDSAPIAAPAGPSVAQRLAEVEIPLGGPTSAFEPPIAWLPPEPEPEAVAQEVVEADAAMAAAEAFRAGYRLSAVAGVADGRRDQALGFAFVTGGQPPVGRTMRVGESAGGFTLERVTATCVVFSREGIEVRLHLPTATGQDQQGQIIVRQGAADNGD